MNDKMKYEVWHELPTGTNVIMGGEGTEQETYAALKEAAAIVFGADGFRMSGINPEDSGFPKESLLNEEASRPNGAGGHVYVIDPDREIS